ncbi:capsular biosynthesis protein [Acetobacteraceae bacterium H6797]|nr:capsular biosynthesis protein [Acetobacteraceae bacterium H6797]
MTATKRDDGPTRPRVFLMLQGLATPFFARLGEALTEAGQIVWKVNFNGGDRHFWPHINGIDYRGTFEDWPAYARLLMRERGVTDLVLFADCRPLHRAAIKEAQALGIAVHVFEEGYLRPGWITLERDGTNGFSSLPRDPMVFLREGLAMEPLPLPAELGASFLRRASDDVRYNIANALNRWRFRHWRTHRGLNVWHEYAGWLARAGRRPVQGWLSKRRIEALLNGKAPFYVFPLQLESDFQIRIHSPYDGMAQAIDEVVRSFARHAPKEAQLALKGHPLDNGLVNWGRIAGRIARAHGVAGRVHWIPEAPFGPLLTGSRGVVTINSTAGLQAIWAGKPTVALGRAIYALPGMTFQDGLDRFWAEGQTPDFGLVEAFRRVVAARCLIRGSFFSDEGIELGVKDAVERFLAEPPPVGVPGSAETREALIPPEARRKPEPETSAKAGSAKPDGAKPEASRPEAVVLRPAPLKRPGVGVLPPAAIPPVLPSVAATRRAAPEAP